MTIVKKGHDFHVSGPLFFASTTTFIEAFEHIEDKYVTIEFKNSHRWDESAVGAVLKVKQKLEARNCVVNMTGFNSSSETLYDQFM